MNGRILLLITLLATSSIANAQLPGIPIFQFGIKGGANITKIDGQSFKDEFEFGYHAGGFAIIKLSKSVQLQPEVLFNQYNTKVADDFEDEITNPENLKGVSLKYLSIPLLLNIAPSRLLAFQIGPQYGILMNKDNSLVTNGKNAFKDGDFSMLGGIQLSIGSLKFSGRYTVGLNDISDLPDRKDWKNQGFQLSVGYRIL